MTWTPLGGGSRLRYERLMMLLPVYFLRPAYSAPLVEILDNYFYSIGSLFES